ncbi:hypothetical protein [Flammeovirga sp. EKP202]|uniref:hypothetical protein n=1 Tax=Flammeovirga sp. EKP202 TaxID=2770592 RepID=UPI00165F4A37|nr:hypothetical protein [Flammeovirga sp. EKP202]MBD0403203.1 hypothetical protein [Flammeovirga sp. EKP202]
MENINEEIVEDYKEAISEVQEAIRSTLGEKNAQHPGVVGTILQGIQLKRIADLMEMNHLDTGEEYEEEVSEDKEGMG